MRLLHIIAGLFGIASGAVALYALKGAKLHRKSGMIFVYTMLVLSASGAVMGALKPQRLSVIAGVLTFYLVMTALLTVQGPVPKVPWMDAGALLIALTVGIAGVTFGFEALNSATGTIDGQPAAPGFIFGAVALLAALGDIRMMLARGIQGAPRIARHLWRMCFALSIAAGASLLLGRGEVLPKPLRNPAVLAIPVLLVLLVMFYWLARVLYTRRALPSVAARMLGKLAIAARSDPQQSDERAPHHVDAAESSRLGHVLEASIRALEVTTRRLHAHLKHVLGRRRANLSSEHALEVANAHRHPIGEILHRKCRLEFTTVGLLPGAAKAFEAALSADQPTLQHELAAKGVRIQAVLPGATATDLWERAGLPWQKLPPSIVMSAEDMVDAALAGLDQGELVTIPGLHEGDEWTRFEAARRAISQRFGNSVPAPRYGTGVRTSA